MSEKNLKNKAGGVNDFTDLSGREEIIMNKMQQALSEDGFYVMYQPIFSTSTGTFSDAEALVRMKPSGNVDHIGPDEFIPLAEKKGLITQIGADVIQKVCNFISSVEYDKVCRININLSVVQCMQENLHESLMLLIDKYNISHDRITFEVTETAAACSSGILKKNMEKCISNGIRFAMDDYGSGFAGTGYLIDYPFATVKLDKKFVWNAFKNKKAMSVLRNTINMIKEMDMLVVAEGVETEKQAAFLLNAGCDLLQGYFYSRPVSETEFVKFLKH